MAEFISLYSGSSGNCHVVKSGERYLMIDMGKSCRMTVNALKEANLTISACDGILITHEHSDHVKGLRVFLSKYNLPVYGCAQTIDMLLQNDLIPQKCEANIITYVKEDIGAFEVESFPVSHDVPCVGYKINTPDAKSMAIATDIGTFTKPVNDALSGCNLVAIESNYDEFMLKEGRYPYYLKVRIQSTRGHMCNEACSEKVLELVKAGCKNIALCHLSQENNTPERALHAVLSNFASEGFVPPSDCIIQAQRRSEVSPVIYF